MVCIPGLFEVLGQKLLRHDRAGDARAGLLGKTGAKRSKVVRRGGTGTGIWDGEVLTKLNLNWFPNCVSPHPQVLVRLLYRSFGGAMEALSRKTEKEKLVELEEMLADATTLTGV